jgi:putative MATE family efflux protein
LIQEEHKLSNSKKYEMDMTSGPLMGKIFIYSLPLMASGVLQLFFNAADIIVVGQFTGPTALAAVGSTGALINLIVNIFIGLSVGTNVLVARYYGAQKNEDLSDTVHTSIAASLLFGIILIVIGIVLAYPLLRIMGSPDDVIDQAVLYMRIIFIGMPAMMLYNFGAAILRSIGDTKRPLIYLSIAGAVNVVLNLIMVIVFHLGVAGVAIATVISNTISAVLVLICLVRSDGPYRVDLHRLRINRSKLAEIAKIGLPAGFQGAIFSISNVLIQSAINSFGSTAMAGSTAAGNLEGFVYLSMNAFYQACLSFTSQNLGAGNYKRIYKVLRICLLYSALTGVVLGALFCFFGKPLLHIYSNDDTVIEFGMRRLLIVCLPYFLCGIMDVMVGSLRGLGYSITPMIVSLIGVCAFRIFWIYSVFAIDRSFEVLFLSYPVSWAITALAHLITFLYIKKKKLPKDIKIQTLKG